MTIGIRKATKIAEDCALGLLAAMDYFEFWGDEVFLANEDSSDTLEKAREIVMNRIRRG